MPHDSPTTAADSLPSVRKILQDGIDNGQQFGAQVFVVHREAVVADYGIGESQPGVVMTPDTINPWLSCGKPLTAVAICRLAQSDQLQLDDPVCRHIPEFAGGRKDAITIRHLLTHSSGLPEIPVGWPDTSWDDSIAKICRLIVDAADIPGQCAEYVPTSGWFILGEIVQRVSGTDYTAALREFVLRPFQMLNCWNGMPPAAQQAAGDRIGWLYLRKRRDLIAKSMHEANHLAAPSPGLNTRGPAREIGLFYARLIQILAGDATEPISKQTLTFMTQPERAGRFDKRFQHVLDFGLGFLLNSNQYGTMVPYGFGRASSSRTFGHGGSQSSMAFADPDNELAVAWFTNGRIGEPRHQLRNLAINEAIYADLGLA